ncbi:MAG: ABC transporter permease subunit [Thermomicrobiales bacterium]
MAQAPALVVSRQAATSPWPLRWRAAGLIARQEFRDALSGWGLYITAAIAILAGALLQYNIVRSVEASGLEIVSRPLWFPLLVAVSLAALYLAAWASLAIARPREQGALRVLFFAPVDPVAVIGGHALAGMAMHIVFLLLITPVFMVMAWIVNLPFPTFSLAGLAASPLLILPAIGIGLLISAAAPSARSAMLIFAAVLAGLLLVQAGYSALLQVPPSSRYYDALLFLREALRLVRLALQWVSPLALVNNGLDAATRADWGELAANALAGLVGGLVWLTLAVTALGRRGVLP